MNEPVPYGIRVAFTFEKCGVCGAVWIPDGEYTKDCPQCQHAKWQIEMIHNA